MKRVLLGLIFINLLFIPGVKAQLGIRAGINMANEIKSLTSEGIAAGFKTENLSGYHLGLVYQAMPKKSGLGGDFGILFSQKGCTFSDSISLADNILNGYKEINYIEIPFNLRYRLKMGFVAFYVNCGLYTGMVLSGKTVTETINTIQEMSYQDFKDRLDFGVNWGGGLELFKKVQLGTTWSYGLKETNNVTTSGTFRNKVFSINMVYLL